MAIDTETKRRAVLCLQSGPRVFPVADASIGAADREYVHFYGIAVTTPVVGPPDLEFGLDVGGTILGRLPVGGIVKNELPAGGLVRF